MPWSATREGTLESLKDKSLEVRQLFAKVANESLSNGKSEQESIRAGLAAVANLEHSKKKIAKAALDEQKRLVEEKKNNYKPPSHLSAIFEAIELKKQQREQEELEFNLKVNKAVEEAIPSTQDIKEMYFDIDGKLVIAFTSGDRLKTKNAVPEEVINKYISVAVNPVQKSLEPMTILNASGDPEIVFGSDGEIYTTVITIEE